MKMSVFHCKLKLGRLMKLKLQLQHTLIICSDHFSQLYHDGFGPHASLLEQAALNTNRAVGPSDRLKQMLSLCAHTVREVDNYFDEKYSTQPCM